MARKSNKTSHVLNLLAGYEDKEKTAAEAQNTEDAVSKTEEKPIVTPQNIAVIDNTEDDSLAQLIQEQLTKELDAASADTITDTDPVETPEPEATEQENAEQASTSEATEPEATEPETTEPETTESVSTSETTEPEAVETETTEPENAEPEAAAPVNKEPDFVTINVMERVVKDKIMYFMRQFDVCTCDRCIADATALALNGLTPKYIVTTPAAVDPLISFYTNKFISDVTVEATKACMIIKETPRH